MTMDADLVNRFSYHAPTRAAAKRHDQVNALTLELARRCARLAPACRELSVALTKLQEVRSWMNAAIACNQELLGDDGVES